MLKKLQRLPETFRLPLEVKERFLEVSERAAVTLQRPEKLPEAF